MANNTIITKKSSTAGVEPDAGDLAVGELAVNTADGKLFTKHSDGSIVGVDGKITLSELTPSAPDVNDVWVNSASFQIFTYYDDGAGKQWVEVGGGKTVDWATITTESYTVLPSLYTVDEGSSVTFQITAEHASAVGGDTIDYTLTGIDASDTDTPLTGTLVLAPDRTVALIIGLTADLTTEGPETIDLKLIAADSSIVGQSTVAVNDTSLAPPMYTYYDGAAWKNGGGGYNAANSSMGVYFGNVPAADTLATALANVIGTSYSAGFSKMEVHDENGPIMIFSVVPPYDNWKATLGYNSGDNYGYSINIQQDYQGQVNNSPSQSWMLNYNVVTPRASSGYPRYPMSGPDANGRTGGANVYKVLITKNGVISTIFNSASTPRQVPLSSVALNGIT